MLLLQEIAAKIIIPPLKALLIHFLAEKGFSQRRIARLLGITQPQVHKYLSKPRDYYLNLLVSHGFSIERINDYLNTLFYTALREDKVRLVLLMSSIVNDLSLEYLCRGMDELKEYCKGRELVDPYIELYKSFISRILVEYDLSNLIPEVGSNIVYAPYKPESIIDIIGLSGRIIRVGGVVKAIGEPVYGGSRHLSRILLLSIRNGSNYRVAMNIKYYEMILEELSMKYPTVKCGPHKSMESFWENIGRKLADKPRIIGDLGGYGLEPVIYLFARDFNDLRNMLEDVILVISKK
jgi:predicted fused transcriptional regulator/phosphomethylpyrimidine kinase/predicted transcriptional regulator